MYLDQQHGGEQNGIMANAIKRACSNFIPPRRPRVENKYDRSDIYCESIVKQSLQICFYQIEMKLRWHSC